MVIGPVNHAYLELVCRETVCGIRAIKDLPRPVRHGSRKGVAPMPWLTEPANKAFEGLGKASGHLASAAAFRAGDHLDDMLVEDHV